MTEHLGLPDPDGVEAALITATGDGLAERQPVGDGSLWRPRVPNASHRRPWVHAGRPSA
jgi:hypothetical protein